MDSQEIRIVSCDSGCCVDGCCFPVPWYIWPVIISGTLMVFLVVVLVCSVWKMFKHQYRNILRGDEETTNNQSALMNRPECETLILIHGI
ncbi:hypothetical protein Zmor_000418 [Zophobas morio]|uniref:Uncharacterized protein n=1 Tax=Zophobas morio TaxID=2755281 RepID=A0AA38MRA1_9CUCU|nr:hypothetical protein Zmor_000418 [Zophobas morio]